MLLFSGFVQKYYCPESVEILILGTCVRRCWFRKGLALSNGNKLTTVRFKQGLPEEGFSGPALRIGWDGFNLMRIEAL